MKSRSVLEGVQIASEGWLYDAYFSGMLRRHTQPVTSQTETDVLNTIVELGTFWSSQAGCTLGEYRSCAQSPRDLELE